MHLLYLGMGRFTQKIRVKQLEIYDMELLINGGHDNPKLGEKLFSFYYWHITFIYIESFSFHELSLRAPLAGCCERQIVEGDNFLNYGGKDQCM